MIGVNVAQLLHAPVGTTRSYLLDDDEPELQQELSLKSPIVGTLKLTRTNHGILAEAQYTVEVEQECGRCLDPARSTIVSDIREEILPSYNIVTGLPVDLDVDPDSPRINANHEVDLTDLIRQDIVVQQPLQPLCRPDCPGLCPSCGLELQTGACGCAAQDDDTPAGEGQLGRLGELLKARLQSGS
jgi:DUF177 domain-containing protein